jgi:hypothetical protein
MKINMSTQFFVKYFYTYLLKSKSVNPFLSCFLRTNIRTDGAILKGSNMPKNKFWVQQNETAILVFNVKSSCLY